MSESLESYRPWDILFLNSPVSIGEGAGWVTFATHNLSGLEDGTYRIGIQFSWNSDSASSSTQFRANINGTVTEAITEEAKDLSDIKVPSYFLKTSIVGGVLDIVLEGNRESGGGSVTTVLNSSVEYERKKEN